MSQSIPTVVIVGRPNVGKSTLFNRITGQRRAIVGDEPGITRDRLHGVTEYRGRPFELIDTGGIVVDDSEYIPSQILKQASVALNLAAQIIFLVDGRAEITGSRLKQHTFERIVNLKLPVIGNEPSLAELIHKMGDPRPGSPDDARQRLMAHLRKRRLRLVPIVGFRHVQERARHPFLGGVEKVVQQVLIDANLASKHASKKCPGERGLGMEQTDDLGLLQPQDRALAHGRGRCRAKMLPSQAFFAKEIARAKEPDHRPLALLGAGCKHDASLLDVEDRVRQISLGKQNAFPAEPQNRPLIICSPEKLRDIEGLRLVRKFRIGHKTVPSMPIPRTAVEALRPSR